MREQARADPDDPRAKVRGIRSLQSFGMRDACPKELDE
jgi:hypothetical protein